MLIDPNCEFEGVDVLCSCQAKSKELAEHYSTLQGDLDSAEAKLDEMAQLNRTLVRLSRARALAAIRLDK